MAATAHVWGSLRGAWERAGRDEGGLKLDGQTALGESVSLLFSQTSRQGDY